MAAAERAAAEQAIARAMAAEETAGPAPATQAILTRKSQLDAGGSVFEAFQLTHIAFMHFEEHSHCIKTLCTFWRQNIVWDIFEHRLQ